MLTVPAKYQRFVMSYTPKITFVQPESLLFRKAWKNKVYIVFIKENLSIGFLGGAMLQETAEKLIEDYQTYLSSIDQSR